MDAFNRIYFKIQTFKHKPENDKMYNMKTTCMKVCRCIFNVFMRYNRKINIIFYS